MFKAQQFLHWEQTIETHLFDQPGFIYKIIHGTTANYNKNIEIIQIPPVQMNGGVPRSSMQQLKWMGYYDT